MSINKYLYDLRCMETQTSEASKKGNKLFYDKKDPKQSFPLEDFSISILIDKAKNELAKLIDVECKNDSIKTKLKSGESGHIVSDEESEVLDSDTPRFDYEKTRIVASYASDLLEAFEKLEFELDDFETIIPYEHHEKFEKFVGGVFELARCVERCQSLCFERYAKASLYGGENFDDKISKDNVEKVRRQEEVYKVFSRTDENDKKEARYAETAEMLNRQGKKPAKSSRYTKGNVKKIMIDYKKNQNNRGTSS